jgi:hypothetical protein
MEERYWFVVVYINTEKFSGKANFGIITDKGKPLSNKFIKNEFLKKHINIEKKNVVIENFIEFKTKQDFYDFWEE